MQAEPPRKIGDRTVREVFQQSVRKVVQSRALKSAYGIGEQKALKLRAMQDAAARPRQLLYAGWLQRLLSRPAEAFQADEDRRIGERNDVANDCHRRAAIAGSFGARAAKAQIFRCGSIRGGAAIIHES